MSIGQLPRLSQLTLGGIREWSDQFAQKIEFLFASPRQIGLAEIIQFQAVADLPGFVTIPTPLGDFIVQWGSDTVDPVGPPSPVIGPRVGALSFSLSAPDVTGQTDVTISPDPAAILLTGGAPSVISATAISVTPGPGRASLAGSAPAVASPVSIVPVSSEIFITSSTPVVTTGVPVPAGRRDVIFPVAFQNRAFVAFAIGSGLNAFAYSVADLTGAGFTAVVANGGVTDDFYWLAIGN